MGRVLLALLSTLFLVVQVMAGTWTTNNFLYKPAIGARGDDEKAKFDSGLNRVDSRLANEKWLNDTLYNGNLGTAITSIGSAKTVLSIPAGNWPIAADLTVPANLTLKFAHGALLSIATGKTLTINGPLDAGRYQIFSWNGTGKVVFGTATPRVKAQWWGISSTVDSAAAVSAALAALSNGVVDLGSDTILINSQVNWDISKCALQGDGAKFDATGNAGSAIQATNGSAVTNIFYKWSKHQSGGFEIEGNKTTNPASVGLEITGTREISGFRLSNIAIHGFNIALYFNHSSWAISCYASSFDKLACYDSVYAVKAVNCGETVHFNDGLFFNSTYGFHATGGSYNLNDCHINYNNQAIYATASARIYVSKPFIESNADTHHWIECNGSSTLIQIIGGRITNTTAAPKTKEIGLADQCGSEGIALDGVLLSNFTATSYGVDNLIKVTDYSGRVVCRGMQPFMASPASTPTANLMLSHHLDYLLDSGFETGYAVDWTASAGAGYDAPVIDAVEFHGGAKSLKLAPTVGKQTQIVRSIPCRVGEWGRMSFWIKNNFGTSTDTFRIEAGYLAANGSEVPYYSNAIDLTETGTHHNAWTQLWITPYYPAPAGAVSIYFKFKVGTGVSDGNGKTFIDDVHINMWIN